MKEALERAEQLKGISTKCVTHIEEENEDEIKSSDIPSPSTIPTISVKSTSSMLSIHWFTFTSQII